MDCRKCGAKKITRRRAGVFSCRHCGVQSGATNMDRAGNPMPVNIQPETNGKGPAQQ